MPLPTATARKQALHALDEKETADPYLVIEELFDFADLADAREILWEWLKTTVTGTYHKNLSGSERSAIISMYEKLDKLLEAAYILQANKMLAKKHTKAQ